MPSTDFGYDRWCCPIVGGVKDRCTTVVLCRIAYITKYTLLSNVNLLISVKYL